MLFNPVFVGVSGEVRHPVGVGTEKEDHGVDVSGDTSDRAHINKRAGILVQLPPRAVPVVERLSPGEIVVVRLDVPHVVPIAGRADFLFLQKLEPRDRVGLSGSERGFLSFQCPDSRPESIHRGSQRLFFRREGFKPPGERGFTVFERRFFGFKARKLILKRLLRLTESGLLLGGRRKSCFRFRFRLPDPVPLRFQAFELLHHGFLDFEELEHGVGPLSING